MEKKVKSVVESARSFNSQYGTIYVHLISFEGEDTSYEYNSKSNKCDKFKVGETVNVEVTQRTANGIVTNVVKPVTEAPKQPNVSYSNGKEQGIITYLSCLSSVTQLYAGTGVKLTDCLTDVEMAFNKAMEKKGL